MTAAASRDHSPGAADRPVPEARPGDHCEVAGYSTFGSWIRSFFALAFIAVLILPGLQMITPFADLQREPLLELRKKAPIPALSTKDLTNVPRRVDRYLEDNFGFRDLLVQLGNSARYHLFGISPVETVLRGEQDWLFFTGDQALDSYRGLTLLSEGELSKLARIYQARSDYLAAFGIEYVLMLVPNKESIYPEFVPAQIRRGTLTRYRQVIDYLRARTGVRVVDPAPALLAAKERGLVYRKSDGHWNSVGAFIGYQALISELARTHRGLKPADIAEYEQRTVSEVGELARMLGLYRSPRFTHPKLFPIRRDPWFELGDKQRGQGLPLRFDRSLPINGRTGISAGMLRKALVYRDSFFVAMIPFFVRHFEESVFYTTHKYRFDPVTIDQERPSLVVEQIIERYLRVPDDRDLALMEARRSGLEWSALGKPLKRWVVAPALLAQGTLELSGIKLEGTQSGWITLNFTLQRGGVLSAVPYLKERGYTTTEGVQYKLEAGEHRLVLGLSRPRATSKILLTFRDTGLMSPIIAELRGDPRGRK